MCEAQTTSFLDHVNNYLNNQTRNALPKKALFLVGSNPLPLYVAAKALAPQEIYLLGTPEVVEVMTSLTTLLNGIVVKKETCNGADSVDIKQKTNKLLGTETDVWLFFTGGTKAMALHAYTAWKTNARPEHWAVYLSPKGSRIWLNSMSESFSLKPMEDDNGGELIYDVPKPSLENILQLHNMELKNCSDSHKKETYLNLANKVHQYVIKKGIYTYLELLPPCHWEKAIIYVGTNKKQILCHNEEECPEKSLLHARGEIGFFDDKNFKKDSFHSLFSMKDWQNELQIDGDLKNLDVIGNALRESTPPNEKKRKIARLNTLKWVEAQWLETWVANGLCTSCLFHEIRDSLVFKVRDMPDGHPEMDVCAMRGHTPFVFSCTIDQKPGLGKHKLFEVRMRANQLGGEHARAAVVCLSENSAEVEKQLNQSWEGYGTIKVFGKEDIINEGYFIEKLEEWVNKLEE